MIYGGLHYMDYNVLVGISSFVLTYWSPYMKFWFIFVQVFYMLTQLVLYANSASYIVFFLLMYCNMWSFDYVLRQNLTLTFLVKNENTIQSSFMSYVSDFLSFSLSMNPGFFHHHWSLSAMNIMKDFIMNLYHSSKPRGICCHFSYLYQLHYLACWLG